MSAACEHPPQLSHKIAERPGAGSRRLFLVLSAVVLVYAFLAGLRTVTDFDLGWQMATGRWIAQHHQIPSTEIFSYTAPGQPWIYPAGAELLFYGIYLLGGWALLSWLGAAVCTGTVALLLRRGSCATAALAVLAIPRIALHTTPRADMFTVLLFAAFLALLWQQHETGQARLWLLPLLMVAWVNLHLGFVSGLALLAAYAGVEALEMPWRDRGKAAWERLRQSLPWLGATVAATLVNPWGWGIYRAIFRQNAAMAEHSQWIIEWAAVRLSWTLVASGWSLRGTGGAFYAMLLVAAVAVPMAIFRRQLGAALLIGGATWLSIRHIRFQALFAVVLVVVGGAVLTSATEALKERIEDSRLRSAVAVGVACLVVALACVRSADIVSDKAYLGTTDLGSFGAGLSWWFPAGAAEFLEHEKIPGEVFNSYNEGGYLTWRLGLKYRDYIDGRAIPFGAELFQRNGSLLGTLPDSPEWQSEAGRYGIQAIIVPLGRYNALQFFPVLRQFCTSDNWRPVYLDEVSAVFLRRTPQTESMVERLQIDCATAPIPSIAPATRGAAAFNQWANAAALLQALGRNSEAFAATTQALAIFPDTAFVHFLRGTLLRDAGNLPDAEQQFQRAATLEGNAATWSALADLYHSEGRLTQEIQAREQAVEFLPRPGLALLSLGYAYLDARRPQDALGAFDRAESSLPDPSAEAADNTFLANVSHGRAVAWNALGKPERAVLFEEQTVRLSPGRADDWLFLADLYGRSGRMAEAQQAREKAAAITSGGRPR
jgi:tetratricopeptide (TPR) repeat protein